MTQFLNEVFQIVFVGFSVFILVTSFLRFKNENRNAWLASWTDLATKVIRIAAIGFLVAWLVDLYGSYQSEGDWYSIKSRMTGPYWFGYWIYPFCNGIFPQVFWIKKLEKRRVVRVLAALLILLTFHIEKIIIMITSLHRDYLPSSWTMMPNYYPVVVLYDALLNAVGFVLLLSLVQFVKSKLQRNPTTE